jgi:outer membrane receptor for ferrienterochelin and colicins
MKYLYIILLLYSSTLYGQTITGHVYEKPGDSKQPLPGASIYWSGTTVGTVADENGAFKLQRDGLNNWLVVSYIGFVNDSILVKNESEINFYLKSSSELKGVEIQGKRDGTLISTIKPRNVETITEKELLKAPCCNLSESFETNPTVDVNYADAVTGAKEIQMLGLSGVYTQLLAEAIPTMTGLGNIYGLNYVPGPWMESIQISKGAGSVNNGFEAITGQINIEFKKPENMKDRMFINVFGDIQGRTELNTINKFNLSSQTTNMFMLHGSINQLNIDHNDDTFMDMPLTKQINIYNKINYHSGRRLEGQAGVKLIAENRVGGQVNFDPEKDKGTTNAYGAVINSRRIEVFTKTGLVNPEKPYQSMGLQMQGTYHSHNSWFGLKQYDAEQKSFYANFAYISRIITDKHKFRAGADMKLDYITETFMRKDYVSNEEVPGLYTEYTFDSHEKWGIIAGIRADYHNYFGWFVSPRANIKYNFTPEIIARVSGGKGYRTPLSFADNIGVMVNSKQVLILQSPDAEEAWNGGLNITARFKFNGREGSFSADYYYTTFINQYIIDQFSVPGAVLYYNLNGNSTATSLQSTLTYELARGLDIKIAGKLDDISTDYIYSKNAARPLYAREKALVNVAYETLKKRWRFDATWQWNGKKLLPASITHLHESSTKETMSQPYSLFNAQITRVYRIWEVYIGCENIGNFTQHNPISNADQPFSPGFDASSVWGPLSERNIYGGVRININ